MGFIESCLEFLFSNGIARPESRMEPGATAPPPRGLLNLLLHPSLTGKGRRLPSG